MSWNPAHVDHAILQVVVSLTYDEAVTSKLFQSVVSAARASAPGKGLSTYVELKGVQISMLPGGQPGQPTPATIGYGFQRRIESRIVEDFQIQPGEMRYASTQYKRWDGFRDRLREVIHETLNECLKSVSLKEVKLEYFDQFSTSDKSTSIAELLRSQSQYLPGFAAHEPGPFHAYCGRFEQFNEIERRLVNANVDVLETGQLAERLARIYTVGSDISNKGALGGDVFSRLEELHLLLKNVMGEIITDDTARRISLNSP